MPHHQLCLLNGLFFVLGELNQNVKLRFEFVDFGVNLVYFLVRKDVRLLVWLEIQLDFLSH